MEALEIATLVQGIDYNKLIPWRDRPWVAISKSSHQRGWRNQQRPHASAESLLGHATLNIIYVQEI